MNKLKQLFNRSVLGIIFLILVAFANNSQWGKDSWRDLIEADGKGYYAYLPATVVYHDLNFGFFDSIEKKYPSPYYDYRVQHNGKVADKYFCGTALAMAPFFLSAHAYQLMVGGAADGYTRPYVLSVSLAALAYWMLGLLFVRKLLRDFSVPEIHISWILVLITFGTNGMYYVVCEPAMSHVFSFGILSAFVYFSRQMFKEDRIRYLPLIAFLFGWICLIRPVNGLVLFSWPFLAQSKDSLSAWIKSTLRSYRMLILSVSIFISMVGIQMVVYKIQTGSWWFDAYDGEKFNFLDPHPIDFLFSYKKGFFLYTPIALLAMLGMWKWLKGSWYQALTFSGFLLLLLYVLSSWWSWWYGGSFSARVCIEFYSFLALLLGALFGLASRNWSRIMLVASLLFCLLLCQFQTYQYRYFVIHWEKMDKEHYWRVFMDPHSLNGDNPNKDLLK